MEVQRCFRWEESQKYRECIYIYIYIHTLVIEFYVYKMFCMNTTYFADRIGGKLQRLRCRLWKAPWSQL